MSIKPLLTCGLLHLILITHRSPLLTGARSITALVSGFETARAPHTMCAGLFVCLALPSYGDTEVRLVSDQDAVAYQDSVADKHTVSDEDAIADEDSVTDQNAVAY